MKALFKIILILFVCAIWVNCKPKKDFPSIENGLLDLREYEQIHGIETLEGNWEFYWNEFRLPGKEESGTKNFMYLPGAWNEKKYNKEKLPGMGFATYRLVILFPKSAIGNYLALYSKVFTASKIMVNGVVLAQRGVVGDKRENTVPHNVPYYASFMVQDERVEILYYVSNFHHRKGGFLNHVYIGKDTYLIRYIQNVKGRDLIIIGLILFSMVYHLGLYFTRRKETSALVFSIFCLALLVRTVCTGEKYITEYFPFMSFEAYTGLEFISYYFSAPIFTHLIYILYPIESSRRVVKFLYISAVLFSLTVCFSPVRIYSHFVNAYLFIFIPNVIYILGISILVTIRKRGGALIGTIGYFVLFLTVTNDVLNTTEVIFTGYYAHYGLAIMICSQSVILLIRFVESFERVEVLSHDLVMLNNELEKKVYVRTKDLFEEKISAVKTSKLKDKLMSLLSHDLQAPLGNALNILELLQNESNISPKSRKEFIDLGVENLESGLNMIKQFLNMSRLKDGELNPDFLPCEVNSLVNHVIQSVKQYAANKDIRILNEISTQDQVVTDRVFVQEILLNLLSNAIKFCNKGGRIRIYSNTNEYYELNIEDNGVGMEREILENIFSKSFKVTTVGTEGEIGTGMGLPFCQELANSMKGEIIAQSNPGAGSHFTLKLPRNITMN